jgi:hypothetical protein
MNYIGVIPSNIDASDYLFLLKTRKMFKWERKGLHKIQTFRVIGDFVTRFRGVMPCVFVSCLCQRPSSRGRTAHCGLASCELRYGMMGRESVVVTHRTSASDPCLWAAYSLPRHSDKNTLHLSRGFWAPGYCLWSIFIAPGKPDRWPTRNFPRYFLRYFVKLSTGYLVPLTS